MAINIKNWKKLQFIFMPKDNSVQFYAKKSFKYKEKYYVFLICDAAASYNAHMCSIFCVY